MSAAAPLAAAQAQFAAHLGAVDAAARFAFRRRLRPQDFEDALADTRAASWAAWVGLIARGQDPLQVGPSGIANSAVKYVRGGRRIGDSLNGRRGRDVYRPRAQAKAGFRVFSGAAAAGDEPGPGAWREWLAADNTVSPADEAAFRVDFAAWLAGLPPRKRRVAELLAQGHGTGAVAGLVGLSPGRVSQVRLELEWSWGEYQAGAGPAAR